MKRYIFVPRVEGTASRQAHADLPAGTYEREISKEGFFGPAALLYHRHPPTGWIDFEGPLRPHAFDLNKLARERSSPWAGAPTCCATRTCACASGSARRRMDHLARNADGDELLFVHAGRGDLYLRLRPPRARGRRLHRPAARHDVADRDAPSRVAALLIEATNASYTLPDKGLVGPHAIFDPAMLDMPRDRRGVPRAAERRARVAGRGQAARRGLDRHLSVQSARCGGLARRSVGRADQRAATSGRS